MRKLIFALAAASALSFAVPASAQTFYAGVGYGPSYGYNYGGYGYGYPYRAAWGGPRFYGYDYAPAVTVYAAPPVALEGMSSSGNDRLSEGSFERVLPCAMGVMHTPRTLTAP